MNHELTTTESRPDPDNAVHQAILEEHMRNEAAKIDAQAEAYDADFEVTGDPRKKLLADEKRREAQDYRASINRETDHVGSQYDEMMAVVDKIRALPEGSHAGNAELHRSAREARLHSAMTKYGLIGSESEVYKNSAYRFALDRNVHDATGHARQASFGIDKAA